MDKLELKTKKVFSLGKFLFIGVMPALISGTCFTMYTYIKQHVLPECETSGLFSCLKINKGKKMFLIDEYTFFCIKMIWREIILSIYLCLPPPFPSSIEYLWREIGHLHLILWKLSPVNVVPTWNDKFPLVLIPTLFMLKSSENPHSVKAAVFHNIDVTAVCSFNKI